MILVTDVHYFGTKAVAAGIIFNEWSDGVALKEITVTLSHVADYVSGRFYQRELPCLLELLAQLEEIPDCIIVDGHVFLGEEKKAGLGKHLYDALNGNIPIVGVAKNAYQDTPIKTEVYRGKSKKALYVTSIGLDENTNNLVQQMHGEFRIPTLLKQVDQLCRKGLDK